MKASATLRTAAVFRRNYRKWVSALKLVQAGGMLAWRTEVSRCRTQLGMVIENKQERDRSGKVVRSFYRYVRKAA